MRSSLVAVVVLASVVSVGCECSDSDPPGRRDSGTFDAASPIDTGVVGVDAMGRDASRTDSGPIDGGNCISVECGTDEACFDGLDNDCDDKVDEGCGCTPRTTARCLPSGLDPSVPLCAWGEMTCVGGSEFGEWGECMGAGAGDGGTSPYGCRRIGIMGAPGANPSSNFQAWLETQGAIATRFHDTADAPTLQRAELETYDLVIIDWLRRDYTLEESETLAEWVRDGGALMAMTGHDSGNTAHRHVSLLTALGPNFDRAAGPLNGPAMLLPHPTTRTADGMGTLAPVTFNGGLRTTVPAELEAVVVPIASIGDSIVGVAGPIGEGNVLLFGDEWIEFDSEWATMERIVQLWLNTVTWLAPDERLPICE